MYGRFGMMRMAAAASVVALGLVAPMAAVPVPAQAQQLAELPSVADLADRLLPAVVEITIESKGATAAPVLPTPRSPPPTSATGRARCCATRPI